MDMFSSLPKAWQIFFTRRLPLAMLVLALGAEALAFGLDAVRYRRHDLDLLALNVDRPVPQPAPRVVLFGDSVTQDILKVYKIGEPGQVANLTTNKASGLVGAYLLLKRYLANNPAPRHVLFASTPEFYTFVPEGETARIYLMSVFRKADEKIFLNAFQGQVEPAFSPAILNLDQHIGLKLLALMAPRPNGLIMGTAPIMQIKAYNNPQNITSFLRADIIKRGTSPLLVPSENASLLEKICALAALHGMKLHFYHAPIPQGTAHIWNDNKYLDIFEAQRNEILEKHCAKSAPNINTELQIIPNWGMRDADHLLRYQWTNVYAARLNEILQDW
jgi:hypothetical protein